MGVTSKRYGVGNAGALDESLTHTSDSEEKCQLVIQRTEEVSLRRTTVGKSEHQRLPLIIDVEEGSS
jgi:hypothetical protein